MTFPFTPCRSCLNHTHCPDKQKWKRVIFLCHETVIKSNNRSRSFSLFSQKLPFDVVHQLLDLQHKPHTNFCKQHFQNLHALVSLDLYDYWDSFLLWETSASKGSSSSSFTISTSSRGASIGSMSSPIGAQNFRWTYERTFLPHSFPGC